MSETQGELRDLLRTTIAEHNELLGDVINVFDGPAEQFDSAWERLRRRWVDPLRRHTDEHGRAA